MVVHGDADQVENHEGKEGAYKSNRSTYQYWRTFNGLSHVVERTDSIDLLPGDSTSIQVWETIEEVSLFGLLPSGMEAIPGRGVIHSILDLTWEKLRRNWI